MSSRAAALALTGAAVVLPLGACGGSKQTATETTVLTRVETTTVVPTSSVSAGGFTAITVENGEAVDGPVKIVSAPGDKVRLSVSADSHSTVSVGNLVDFSTIPGGTVSMTFVPDGAGTFPIDLHGPQSLTRIGTLVVQE